MEEGYKASVLFSALIISLLFFGCTGKEAHFEVYRWYEGDNLSTCANSVNIGEEQGRWVVLEIYAAKPMPATDGVRGWDYRIVGSDGNNYTWFSTDWGCVEDFYSEPNAISATEIGTRGNIIFVLPRDVEPEKLVLEIDGTYQREWTFDESMLQEEAWFVVKGVSSGDNRYSSGMDNRSCPLRVSDCGMLNDSASRAFCYQGVAYCEKDTSICEMIGSEEQVIKDNCFVAGAAGNPSVCDAIQNTTNADKCYLMSAQSNADLRTCDSISSQETKDWCYGDVAEKTLNQSVCEAIISTGYRNSCYWGIAVKKPDASLCAKVDSTDLCYRNVAVMSYNASTCDMLPNPSGITGCKIAVFGRHFASSGEKNASVCEMVPDDVREQDLGIYKDTCYQTVSYTLSDVTLCEQIGNDGMEDDCYHAFATSLSDIRLCDKIKNQIDKDMCYQELAMGKLDSSICEGIGSQDYSDLCYGELAMKSLDIALSSNITDTVYRDYAIRMIAEEKGDSGLCSMIQNASEQGRCQSYAGTEKGQHNSTIKLYPLDIPYCGSLTGKIDEDKCYSRLVAYEQETDICELIENQYVKDGCYGELAGHSSNATLCGQIESRIEKDICYVELAIALSNATLCQNVTDDIYRYAKCI